MVCVYVRVWCVCMYVYGVCACMLCVCGLCVCGMWVVCGLRGEKGCSNEGGMC